LYKHTQGLEIKVVAFAKKCFLAKAASSVFAVVLSELPTDKTSNENKAAIQVNPWKKCGLVVKYGLCIRSVRVSRRHDLINEGLSNNFRKNRDFPTPEVFSEFRENTRYRRTSCMYIYP